MMKNKYFIFFWLVVLTAASVVAYLKWQDSFPEYDDAFIDANLSFRDSSEKELAKRFLEYQHYRSAHEFEKTYPMELPYFRYLRKFRHYKSEISTTNNDFNSTLLSISHHHKYNAIVDVTYLYKKNNYTSHEQDRWIRVNGEWYHAYRFSPFPE